MGLNTKCPKHGNLHPDFLCPDKGKSYFLIIEYLSDDKSRTITHIVDLSGKTKKEALKSAKLVLLDQTVKETLKIPEDREISKMIVKLVAEV